MNYIKKIKKYKKHITFVAIALIIIFSLVRFDSVNDEVINVEPTQPEAKEEDTIFYEETLQEKAVEVDDFLLEMSALRAERSSVDRHVYREVPPMVDPNFFVMPDSLLDWQADYISKWDITVNSLLLERPELDLFLVLAVIAQESQGDAKLVAHNPAFTGNTGVGVGLMMITPESWIGTISYLLSPYNNIAVGTSMLNSTIRDAREVHNFAPGLDSVRAGLAAYNCGWKSFLADRCYWFGGWAYADKVLLYWYEMLANRYEGEVELPDYIKQLEVESEFKYIPR